ncbi:Gfo/Idh/MocA family protein [Virgisporangium ochraceum]|uniref:Oxidoreductase n=1 Tax=Virgisporangium ochraceum TaxID=65505 RepID=A0A8J4EGN1_9ACTN|nr:Gfo/Idh/MocA family oxidoreductase [Virgisporangium ochraceum]GIJ73901.1 oxidoreductase [Virgisporangium ochraceum]
MIRVGVVGANPAAGWAGTAHVPAIMAAGGYELTAVATTREESARAAADAYGARRWFVGAAGLVEHSEVDLVVVAVRAASHVEATMAALRAGKHVLVEWPLAVTADDAAGIAAVADEAGVVHAVAAQAWHSPGARFVADLVAEGRVGAVEAVSFVGSGDPHGGSRVAPFLTGSLEPDAGNNLLTIMGGHTLIALERLVGGFTEVSAVVSRPSPVTVVGTGERLASGVAGHLAFVGRFGNGGVGNGAVGSVAVHGGNRAAPAGFDLRITGTEGVLTATPREPGEYINWADWRVRWAPVEGEPRDLEVPESYGAGAGVSANLTHLYREVAAAITEGRPAAPNFHTAARVQGVLAAVERSERTGSRQVP